MFVLQLDFLFIHSYINIDYETRSFTWWNHPQPRWRPRSWTWSWSRRASSVKIKNLGRKNTNLIFSSDDKNFTQVQKVNRQNNRWLCDDPEQVPVAMSTMFPATVMVLGVVSSEGDIMPPHFFQRGLRVNAEVHIDVKRGVVKPWMDQVRQQHLGLLK